MTYIIGEQFSINTGNGSVVDVVTPNCVTYDGNDGGELFFTAKAAGSGTIRVVFESDSSQTYSVSVTVPDPDEPDPEEPDPDQNQDVPAELPIRVFFPAGYNAVRITPVYQWDFGRKLEIHTGDIAGRVELHFMCMGMVEPIAYACTARGGVIIAPIPDECLEHSSDIKVWVYERGECCGRTTREIVVPIIARVRPPRFVEEVNA